MKKRVRKGIPDALRGLAWQLLSGGRDLLLQNEGGSGCRLRLSAAAACVSHMPDWRSAGCALFPGVAWRHRLRSNAASACVSHISDWRSAGCALFKGRWGALAALLQRISMC